MYFLLSFSLKICISYTNNVINFNVCRENPELYLEELRAKYKELSEKMDQRKRLKTNGNGNGNGNGSGNGNNVSGGTGRGERLNAAQRERMRLLTTALYDK